MSVASERRSEKAGLKTNEIDENTSEVVDCMKLKLTDLKVSDIKFELEKRNLDKNGVKSVLLEKLKKALLKEGQNPDEFNFMSASSAVKNCTKKSLDSNMNGDVYSNEIEKSAQEKNKTDELELIDDRMNNEVTLQLSIDEDDAQLNEEENLLELEKSDDEKTVEEVHLSKSENLSSSSSKRAHRSPLNSHKDSAGDYNAGREKKNKSRYSSKVSESSTSLRRGKISEKNVTPKETIWVRSLSNSTKALDVKAIFSKYGKVLSVKIIKSAKQSPGKCYGYVIMSTTSEATKAIQHLNNTELNGKTISVEWNEGESSQLPRKLDSKTISDSKRTFGKAESKSKDQVKKVTSSSENKSKSIRPKQTGEDLKGKSSAKSASKEKDEKSQKPKGRDSKHSSIHHSGPHTRPFSFRDRPRFGAFRQPYRSGLGERSRSMYERMRGDRIHFREKFRERERREAERRRMIEVSRHKYIERKQQEEASRLEREKEKLRLEREQLERERAEILKLEREMQILERERLEREKEELRRQAELRESAVKRPFMPVSREPEPFWDARKKSRYPERSSFYSPKSRLDEPSSSRYEGPSRERSSLSQPEVERHVVPAPTRTEFSERQPRREVRIRPREERRVYERSSFKEPEERSSLSSRDRTLVQRESPRPVWKQERRVQERVVSSRSSGRGTRRMTYY